MKIFLNSLIFSTLVVIQALIFPVNHAWGAGRRIVCHPNGYRTESITQGLDDGWVEVYLPDGSVILHTEDFSQFTKTYFDGLNVRYKITENPFGYASISYAMDGSCLDVFATSRELLNVRGRRSHMHQSNWDGSNYSASEGIRDGIYSIFGYIIRPGEKSQPTYFEQVPVRDGAISLLRPKMLLAPTVALPQVSQSPRKPPTTVLSFLTGSTGAPTSTPGR